MPGQEELSVCRMRQTVNVSPVTDLQPYSVVHRKSSVLMKLPIVEQDYKSSSNRTKRRRSGFLIEVLKRLRMDVDDAAEFCVDVCFRSRKKLPEKLSKYMSPVLQNPSNAAALIAPERFTERQVQFMRSFFNCVPSVQNIRHAKWSFLASTPSLYLLLKNSLNWTELSSRREALQSNVSRDVLCVRFNVADLLLFYLREMKKAESWPTPPCLNFFSETCRSRTVVVLLSIDSGTGTLKLMARFVTETSGQETSDVILLAQSTCISERFDNIERVFGQCALEIQAVRERGLIIDEKTVRVLFLFVADFKVLYSVTGGFGARGTFPCPWCSISRQQLDATRSEASKSEFPFRPEVLDLRLSTVFDRWQKANTFNMFGLVRGGQHFWQGGCAVSSCTTMVPPALHIKIGLVNKVVSALDSLVSFWQKKMNWSKSIDRPVSPAMKQLAAALATVGARREKYYSGQLSGKPCTLFMSRIEEFCDLFFLQPAEDWGLATEAVPGALDLQFDLRKAGALYNGTGTLNGMGVGFFLQTQQRWTEDMLVQWNTLSEDFITALKKAIWRPEVYSDEAGSSAPWRQPMLMPKLHSFLFHVGSFAKHYGFYGNFSEESFEHFQKQSKKNRNIHAVNKNIGAQIVDDMYFSLLQSAPNLRKAQSNAKSETVSKKRRSKTK